MAGQVKADELAIQYGTYHASQFRESLEFGDIKVFNLFLNNFLNQFFYFSKTPA
jgi:hypothetical protein